MGVLCARGGSASVHGPERELVIDTSVHGPELVRVLGWDRKHQCVYVQIAHTDDDEYTPTIWWFGLRNLMPAAPHRLEWSGAEEDAVYEKRLADLRRTLKPLVPEEEVDSMFAYYSVAPVPCDSVESDNGHRARYLARVATGPMSEQHFNVLTLDPGRHAVRLLREYALPGTSAVLDILSTEAAPVEQGYEVQFPVLVVQGRGTADPIDPESFNVRR